jgi:MFS family permease
VDLWQPVHRAVATSAFLLAPFLGPALGPALGGFAAQDKGWRWTQWLLLFVIVPTYLHSLGMKETYKKIFLQNRAKNLGLPPPSKGPAGLAKIKFLMTVTLLRPVKMLFTEPIVFFFSMYTGFNFSVLLGFFDAFPIVFEGVYHFNGGLTGFTFLGIGLGCCLGVVTVITVNRLWYYPQHVKSLKEGRGGFFAPEHRLYVAMMGSFGLPIGLFWFAWTARADIHWVSPVLATIPFAWGNLCIFTAAGLYLVDVYGPLNGASALAANGLVRYISGAAFPLFTLQSE